ncbi:MAG TPA: PAS domain-containing protein [Kiritimatiellae bacterium]|nr:PAS domain-containing protein [Kiritimatiellia bacterium]
MDAVVRTGDGQPRILSWRELVVVVFIRVAIISAAVVVLSFFMHMDSVAFYALVAFGYIATIPYALWIKDVSRGRQVVPLQCVVDILLVTGLVYFTGGPRSELAMLYPLVFLSSGILAGPTMALEISLLGILAYALVVVLVSSGLLPDAGGNSPSYDWASIGETLGMRGFVFLFFGMAGAYLSRRLRFADARVERYRDLIDTVFQKVGVGLLLIDTRGRIYMVNPTACELLRGGEGDLLGHDIREFMNGELDIARLETRQGDRPAKFKRTDGSRFDARFEVSRIRFPAGSEIYRVLNGGCGDSPSGYLIVFSDVTRLLDLQTKARMAERIQAAAEMATEIAHEIRNPLTAVAGSLELLDRLERSADSGDEHSRLLLRQNRSVLYSQVVREAQRMNRIIQRFLDHAEFSPEALKRIMAYADEMAATGPGSTSKSDGS